MVQLSNRHRFRSGAVCEAPLQQKETKPHQSTYRHMLRARVCTSEQSRCLYISLRDATTAVRYYIHPRIWGWVARHASSRLGIITASRIRASERTSKRSIIHLAARDTIEITKIAWASRWIFIIRRRRYGTPDALYYILELQKTLAVAHRNERRNRGRRRDVALEKKLRCPIATLLKVANLKFRAHIRVRSSFIFYCRYHFRFIKHILFALCLQRCAWLNGCTLLSQISARTTDKRRVFSFFYLINAKLWQIKYLLMILLFPDKYTVYSTF